MRKKLSVYEKICKIMDVQGLNAVDSILLYADEHNTPVEKILQYLPEEFILCVKSELQEKFQGKDFFWLG